MDPLSILASLTGLLMAVGKVSSTLKTIGSTLFDAPKLFEQVLSEVDDLKILLSGLHQLLGRLAMAPRGRIAMIQIDQLIATLTEAVFTFSDLEAKIAPYAATYDRSISDRMKWVWKDDDVTKVVQRLQRHKLSLLLMLNIVQCESDLEAEKSQRTLQSMVEQLLESNQDLSRRLQSIESLCESRSVLTRCVRNGTDTGVADEEDADAATITGTHHHHIPSMIDFSPASNPYEPFPGDSIRFDFEDDLATSRVYQRTQEYEQDVSFRSSVVRTHAWSIFTGMSLAEISVISAIALPLFSHELSNSQRYHFGVLNQSMEPPRLFAPIPEAPARPFRPRPDSPRPDFPRPGSAESYEYSKGVDWFRPVRPRPTSGAGLPPDVGKSSHQAAMRNPEPPQEAGISDTNHLKISPRNLIHINYSEISLSGADKMVSSLADDLDASELKELMQRDQRRREKKLRAEVERRRKRDAAEQQRVEQNLL